MQENRPDFPHDPVQHQYSPPVEEEEEDVEEDVVLDVDVDVDDVL
ncbi:MAG: hypothetical protein G01um101425_364 [Candidatus Peregrinibacteria bacterium Gr01-1014_25]|nr:MAG: hypothetical protein G01um101425_364 [Candidatus Peregrinibacteria bacterium Gr01-1014_25]